MLYNSSLELIPSIETNHCAPRTHASSLALEVHVLCSVTEAPWWESLRIGLEEM